MNKVLTLLLAVGMLMGAATGASAIDFKAKGQWLMGFGVGDTKSGQQDPKGRREEKSSTATTNARPTRSRSDALTSTGPGWLSPSRPGIR